jgi:hypothetical protein
MQQKTVDNECTIWYKPAPGTEPLAEKPLNMAVLPPKLELGHVIGMCPAQDIFSNDHGAARALNDEANGPIGIIVAP